VGEDLSPGAPAQLRTMVSFGWPHVVLRPPMTPRPATRCEISEGSEANLDTKKLELVRSPGETARVIQRMKPTWLASHLGLRPGDVVDAGGNEGVYSG
jgi:hypothetical protein